MKFGVLLFLIFGTSTVFALKPVPATKESSRPAKTNCGKSMIDQSRCMITAILKNIKDTYGATGGGGISQIKMTATKVYAVSLLQDERVDVLTYEFATAPNGDVWIERRTESTETPGR